MAPEEKSHIEELKKSLYSRGSPDVRTRRKLRFSDTTNTLNTTFGEIKDDTVESILTTQHTDVSMSLLTKILIGSVVFCIGAVGCGAYLFFNGANLISGDNIDITISGPVSVQGGEPISFDVQATNKNNVALQVVDMSVDFPAGTTDPANPTQELKNYHQLIGDMTSGQSAHKKIDAIIFGEENLQKQIIVTLTYQVKGSSALFTKQKSYDVLINSSSINVSVDSFKEVTSGQEFDMTVKLKSNSQQTLKNVMLKGTYPFGYTYISSNVQPLSDKVTWRIGDIPAGGQQSIIIHGKLQGSNADNRAFHFTIGAQSSMDPKMIGTEYAVAEQDITIKKPFVSLGIAIEGNSDATDYVGTFNQPERVDVEWVNNLPVTISNVQIIVKLSGTAYDKTSVQPGAGYYRSATNDIVWNQQTNPELATVNAGDTGRVSFSIAPRDNSTPSNLLTNPTVIIDASVVANRLQESQVSGSLNSAATRTTRVSTNASLTGRVVYTVGPFVNSGPLPPKAEQMTTYTVLWTVNNTSNTLNNTQVTATVPPYIKWLGSVSPVGAPITYDANSGLITWSPGNVGTYTSTNAATRKEVAFQIGFQPSVTQINQSPNLLNEANLTGIDSFTGATIQNKQDYLTTRFSTDPGYKEGQATVVK